MARLLFFVPLCFMESFLRGVACSLDTALFCQTISSLWMLWRSLLLLLTALRTRRGQCYIEQHDSPFVIFCCRCILEWFRTKRTSPTTGAVLTRCVCPFSLHLVFTLLTALFDHAFCSTNLIPNHSLKSQINQWREEQVWHCADLYTFRCCVCMIPR